MIYFRSFNSVDEINSWYGVQQSVDIINIETLPPDKPYNFRIWYRK